MYRSHPLTAAAESVVRDGRLGTVRVIRGAFTFPLTRERDIRLDAGLGGGSLWDVGCYPVSYSCMLIGEAPIDVIGWQELSPAPVSTSHSRACCACRMASLAQFDAGFHAAFRAEMETRRHRRLSSR